MELRATSFKTVRCTYLQYSTYAQYVLFKSNPQTPYKLIQSQKSKMRNKKKKG